MRAASRHWPGNGRQVVLIGRDDTAAIIGVIEAVAFALELGGQVTLGWSALDSYPDSPFFCFTA